MFLYSLIYLSTNLGISFHSRLLLQQLPREPYRIERSYKTEIAEMETVLWSDWNESYCLPTHTLKPQSINKYNGSDSNYNKTNNNNNNNNK